MKARAIKGIVVKDLKEISREKVALFWVFVFPLMWVTLFGSIWGGGGEPITIDLGVVYSDEDTEFTAQDVVEIMENISIENAPIFNTKRFDNETAGVKSIKKGTINALVVFPNDFGKSVVTGKQAKIYLYFDKSDPQEYQIVSGVVKGFFAEFEKEMKKKRMEIQLQYAGLYISEDVMKMYNISLEDIKSYMVAGSEPLVIEEKEVEGTKVSPIKFYITSFIGIQFLFATMLIIGVGILEEIEKGTLKRVVASPATSWDFLIGKIASTFIIVMFSILVGLTYSRIVFGETLVPSLAGWLIILIASVFSMSLGIIIAMATRSIRSTTALVNLLSMPLLFLAGVVIPEAILPSWAKPIVNYFPLGRALKDLRLLELYHKPFVEIVGGVIYILAVTVVMLLASVVLYNRVVKTLE